MELRSIFADLALVSTVLLGPSLAFGNGPVCGSLTNENEIAWRSNMLQRMADGSVAETSTTREVFIKQRAENMANYIKNDKDTPWLEIVPADNVKITRAVEPNDKGGQHLVLKVEPGADGKLPAAFNATLLLPVSGHTGYENATKWRLTDTYTIRLREGRNGPYLADLVKDARSKDYITTQEVNIPLTGTGPLFLEYWRSGSGGPAGYYYGRVIEIQR